MADIDATQQTDLGTIASNTFGERYLFGINRNLFQGSDAGSVFRSFFGDKLFEEDQFYVIAGTDSGLLYQFVMAQGLPKGSRYLFVERPEVLALMADPGDQHIEVAVTTGECWLDRARELGAENYATQGRITLVRSMGVVHAHYHRYSPFWRQLKKEFDAFIFGQQLCLSNRNFIKCQIENLTENQTPAIALKNTFQDKTAVVLAGGPSLDYILPWVQKHRQNLLVIAVSRISRSLLQAGVQPDISVSVDPQNFNLNVCKEVLKFQEGTLLVNSNHLSSNLLASWGGEKAFIGNRYPWKTPLQPENIPPPGGTTVTNSALDIALQAGAAQVVLGGADFCFNQNGYTHASGTAEHARGPMIQMGDQQVKTNGGMMADTTNSYLQSAKSIDKQAQIAVADGCLILNPAIGAMRLQHVQHVSLDQIHVEPLERPAREIIANSVPQADKGGRIRLYKEALSEVDRLLSELRSIKAMTGKALNLNHKLFARGEQGAGLQNKPKIDRIENKLDGKYAGTTEFVKQFGVQRFVPVLRYHDLREEGAEEHGRLYFQAFLDTSTELIDIMSLARARILSRLEEEKPEPDITSLVEQWHRDEQPGRAILWAEHHAEYVNQLTDEHQQALRAFQASWKDSMEELGERYAAWMEKVGEVGDVAGRAREYFRYNDLEGLRRIESGLQGRSDTTEVENILSLVQGYRAELENDTDSAISYYESIGEGQTYLDALMRLFALHSGAGDFGAALADLKLLSGICSVYSPMYADMLNAIGDLDAAVEVYTEYLLANPDDLDTAMKLGRLFLKHESMEGVEWSMNYILSKDPGNLAAQQILDEVGLGQGVGS